MNKVKLLVLLAAGMAIVLTASPAVYAEIISPGDFIIGIDSDGDGIVREAWGHYAYELIDGIITGSSKTLVSGAPNGGFIITPSDPNDPVRGFKIATSNDTVGRDPSSWILYGTNDAILSVQDSDGTAENWTLIDSGTLALPDTRLLWSDIVAVNNNTVYTSYKILFPTIKNPALPDMQMCELQFTNYSVDAGADMITWSGAAVQLAPIAGGYDPATSTYNWIVDLPAGVEAAFDPSETAAAPTVTFTKVPYSNANIINESFEDIVLDDATGVQGDPAGWTHTGGGTTNPGVINLATGLYGGIAPDGDNMGWVQRDQYLSQDLTETFQVNATYTLTAAVGFDSRWGATSVSYAVQLLTGSGAGTALIAEETGTITDPNNFVYASVEYVYDAADADKIGQPLQIRLVGTDPAGDNANVFFDNLVLTSSIPFPASSVATAALTLTVQDTVNPALSGTMTVDIYDDACSATRIGLNVAGAHTDLSGDCITNLEDFAALAMDWLINYAYDKAQVKPAQ